MTDVSLYGGCMAYFRDMAKCQANMVLILGRIEEKLNGAEKAPAPGPETVKALRELLSSMSDGLEESLEVSFVKLFQTWQMMFPREGKEIYMRGAQDFIMLLMNRLDEMEKEEAQRE